MNSKSRVLTIILSILIVIGVGAAAFFVYKALTTSPESSEQTTQSTTPEGSTGTATESTSGGTATETTTANSDGSVTTKKSDGSSVTVKDATNGYEEVTTVDASGKSSTVLRPKQ
jgi:cytoskeletal protein RodZ